MQDIGGKVTILPLDDGPLFARREFAGYLKMRIPHPLDEKVLLAINDSKLRAAMTPEDVSVLSVFAHRKAVEAVRSASPDALRDGFLAVAVAIGLTGDIREVFMALAPLFHSAQLLHVTDEEILESLSDLGVSRSSIDEIRKFSQRPEKGKSLSSMGLRQEGSGANLRYV